MSGPLCHVVLVKFQPDVPENKRSDTKLQMVRLGAACGGEAAGIIDWQADWNLDRRKGYDLMSVAVFANPVAFETYRAHPAHVEFAAAMSRVADWVVGDMHWKQSDTNAL